MLWSRVIPVNVKINEIVSFEAERYGFAKLDEYAELGLGIFGEIIFYADSFCARRADVECFSGRLPAYLNHKK